MSKTVVTTYDLGRLVGDPRPCDAGDCPERATRKVQVVAGSVQTLACVCDEHYAEVLPR